MDFKLVLEKILSAFEQSDVRYALVGGFALGVWGVPRATVDIDFLVLRDDLGKVREIMTAFDYQCIHASDNVSQYVAPLKTFGEVDFLHAFRTPSVEMLKRSGEHSIYGGSLKIKVARPEDLIGLKVQAMANDEARKISDLADIEALMAAHGKTMDWQLIEDFFAIFDMTDTVAGLKEKYGPSH